MPGDRARVRTAVGAPRKGTRTPPPTSGASNATHRARRAGHDGTGPTRTRSTKLRPRPATQDILRRTPGDNLGRAPFGALPPCHRVMPGEPTPASPLPSRGARTAKGRDQVVRVRVRRRSALSGNFRPSGALLRPSMDAVPPSFTRTRPGAVLAPGPVRPTRLEGVPKLAVPPETESQGKPRYARAGSPPAAPCCEPTPPAVAARA